MNPGADDAAIDAALGVPGDGHRRRRASRCRAACSAAPRARPTANPATAWNTPFVGVGGQWVQFDSPQPITFSHMNLQVVADGRHSVPTHDRARTSTAPVRELTLPPIAQHRLRERDAHACRCTSRR